MLPYWPRERYLELSPKHWTATRARLRPEELAAALSAFEVPDAAPASDVAQPHTLGNAIIDSFAEVARGIDAFASLAKRAISAGISNAPPQMLAPPTPINRTIGNARSYAVLRVSLTDVKAIGKTHQCSVNDVFLTVCGGACVPIWRAKARCRKRHCSPAYRYPCGAPVIGR